MTNTNLQTKKQLNLGIRSKILLIFSVFSLIALILINSIILGYFAITNNTTTSESESALTNQIQNNLVLSANENAHTIGEKIQNSINYVNSMAYFASDIFNNPEHYGNYSSYSDIYSDHATDPNIDFEKDVVGYGPQYISFNYSMYHLANNTYNSEDYSTANSSVQNMINTSANLDHIYRYTYQANPDFGWIYMGFELGIFRGYPWSEYDEDYDPRLRGWYSAAKSNPFETIITDPYVDANGLGLMITIAKAVYYDENGTLIGVIAADLTIDTIKSNILNINFLETGYAFLINQDGLVIVHDDLVEPEADKDFTTTLRDIEGDIEENLYSNITTLNKGIGSYDKQVNISATEKYYIAFSIINGTNFVLINVVPEAEALLSVAELQIEVDAANKNVRTFLIVIIILAGIVSVLLGVLIASKITKPVEELTNSIKKLTSQSDIRSMLKSDSEIVIDSKLEAQDDEIGDLARAFKGMLSSMKDEE